MKIPPLRKPWFALPAAALVALALLLSAGTGSSRADSCITTLPLSWSLSSFYAASYSHEMDIDVRSNGPRITGLSVSVSTFDGDILGKGTLHGALTGSGTIHVKLTYPMQPGRFTLYFYGFPNSDPSCGPKHDDDVLRLTGCVGSLPVKISGAAEGPAADYSGTYSFNAEPTGGQLFKNLTASLKVIGGPVVGQKAIPVLFGNLRVVIPITGRRGIAPGPTKYSLAVSGYTGGRPLSCGPLTVNKVLTFT